MARVCIDPGHGGRDRANRGPGGYVEADGILKCALALAAPTGAWSVKADLYGRSTKANDWGPDVLVSIHTNAFNGRTRGTEVYCQWSSPEGYRLADLIRKNITADLGTADRGVRVRDYETERIYLYENRPVGPGHIDYYHILREVKAVAVMVELEYHDHPKGEELLLTPGVLDEKAPKALARAILVSLGIAVGGTPIMGKAQISAGQAAKWYWRRLMAGTQNPSPEYVQDVIEAYWSLGTEEGVRPEVALAQAMKETGFLQFGGAVRSSQNNFCGLGATGGGNPGLSFPNIEAGVLAHVRHLRLYVEQDKNISSVLNDYKADPRGLPDHLQGSSPTVEGLGGKWAPSPDYGQSIVQDYLSDLLNVKEPVAVQPVDDLKEKLEQCRAELAIVTAERDQLRARIEKIRGLVS